MQVDYQKRIVVKLNGKIVQWWITANDIEGWVEVPMLDERGEFLYYAGRLQVHRVFGKVEITP